MSNKKVVQRAWTSQEDDTLRRFYMDKTREEIAVMLGRTKASVRARCSVLGLNHKHPPVTQDELDLIRRWYTSPEHATDGDFALDNLAAQLGRTKYFISRLAGKMGLTNYNRPIGDELKRKMRDGNNNYFAIHGRAGRTWKVHPRGMLGKKHTDEFKRAQSIRGRARVFTPEQTAKRIEKMMNTRIAKYGSGNPRWLQRSNPYSRTRSGKRADLGDQFFRSSWEANYARYLNWLVEHGEIVAWEFESKTFVFDGASRGVVSYTPDFKVIRNDGAHEWHEVKGWMDANSKARLALMAEHYPGELLIVIDRRAYTALEKQFRNILPNWEYKGAINTKQPIAVEDLEKGAL